HGAGVGHALERGDALSRVGDGALEIADAAALQEQHVVGRHVAQLDEHAGELAGVALGVAQRLQISAAGVVAHDNGDAAGLGGCGERREEPRHPEDYFAFTNSHDTTFAFSIRGSLGLCASADFTASAEIGASENTATSRSLPTVSSSST